MRVCVISTPIFRLPLTGYGGLEAIAWETARGLAARGHEVALVAPDGSECPGVQIIPCGPAGQVDEKMAYSGFPEAKDQQGNVLRRQHAGYWSALPSFDVVIDHTWMKWAYELKAEGVLKAPVLGVFHAPVNTMYQMWPPNFPLKPVVEKACPVCISYDQAEHFQSIHNRHARVAYNGVDVDNFYVPLPGVKRTDRFLFLARFSTVKSPHLAIEACLKAGVGLDLVGDTSITNEPQYFEHCMQMARQQSPGWDASKEQQIVVHGGCTRGETVIWYNKAHALIHPTQHFCHLPSQKILTARGAVSIREVTSSDRVLSHNGKMYSVSSVFRRRYRGTVRFLRHSSFSGRVKVTPGHPLYAIRPRVCACMGASSGTICKPTYGGSQRCRELSMEVGEKQKVYDQVMSRYASGEKYGKIAKDMGIADTTAYYWTRGKTPRPERDLQMPYCDFYTPEWKPASEIGVGDFLVTPVPDSVDRSYAPSEDDLFYKEPLELTDDLLSLCGWFIAEGWTDRGKVRFGLHAEEYEHSDEIRGLLRRVFNSKSAVYFAKDSRSRVVESRKKVGTVLKRWFGGRAAAKSMPEWIFLLPPDKLKWVIRAMWRGDGCKVDSGGYESLSYTTASPSLAMQLWMCLTKFGIISYLVEKKASENTKNPGGIIYNLNVRGDGAKKLAELVGWDFCDNRRETAWKGMSYIHKGSIYSRITAVEDRNYDGWVYNMTVPETNSYVAQLISSHNCEPFGLAPVEAAACGCPVIAWNYGAVKETVADHATGRLVNSMDELVGAIQAEWIRYVSPAYRLVCREYAKRFSLEKMTDGYEKLIHEAITTGGW